MLTLVGAWAGAWVDACWGVFYYLDVGGMGRRRIGELGPGHWEGPS